MAEDFGDPAAIKVYLMTRRQENIPREINFDGLYRQWRIDDSHKGDVKQMTTVERLLYSFTVMPLLQQRQFNILAD